MYNYITHSLDNLPFIMHMQYAILFLSLFVSMFSKIYIFLIINNAVLKKKFVGAYLKRVSCGYETCARRVFAYWCEQLCKQIFDFV